MTMPAPENKQSSSNLRIEVVYQPCCDYPDRLNKALTVLLQTLPEHSEKVKDSSRQRQDDFTDNEQEPQQDNDNE